MTELAQHSSKSVEHYTPKVVVEPSRSVLETIDLDPASCEIAQGLVQATYWCGYEGEATLGGLGRQWFGNVFLNPPGGKLDPETFLPFKTGKGRSAADGVSAAAVWWSKLVDEWQAGHVRSAIFVCFSMSVFRTGQAATLAPYMFPFVVPVERINYDHVDDTGTRVPSSGAPADSAIIYIPPSVDHAGVGLHVSGKQRFQEHFGHLGVVRL